MTRVVSNASYGGLRFWNLSRQAERQFKRHPLAVKLGLSGFYKGDDHECVDK
jgi:hypothetical protein